MNKKIILGYAIGPIGSGLLGFISLPIVTWFYSVEDVGRISMLQIYISLSVLLFTFGLDQAYVREYHESKNKGELLKNLSFPTMMLTVIVLIGVVVLKPYFISRLLYDIESIYLSIITITAMIFSIVSRYLSLILRMQEKAIQFSMSQIIPKLLFLVFIINVVVLQLPSNTESLVTANALSIIFASIIYVWNTRVELKEAFKAKINFELLHKGIIFGLPLFFGSLAGWGLNIADRLFLKNYSSLSELGVYSVSMSIAMIATLFASIFNTMWAPMVFKWQSQNLVDVNKIHDIAKYVAAIIYFCIVIIGIFSWIVPYFFKIEYRNIQYLLPSCLLAPLLYTLSEVTGVGISLQKKTKYIMIASFLAMLVSVSFCYFLVPLYGAKGAASATASAFFVFFLARTLFSEMIWQKIYDLKFYIPLLSLFLTVQLAIFENSNVIYLAWFITLFVGIFFYRRLITMSYNKLFNFKKRS